MLRHQVAFRRGLKTLHKDIRFADSARISVLNGATKLYDAVAVTLGPKGRNVLMEQQYNFPKITKDGYSIAQELKLQDPHEDLGCQLLKDIASKSNDESGDGTTTSTVLAYNILNKSLRHVTTGANPNEVRRGVQLGIDKVLEFLESQKKEITSHEQIRNIAFISSNGDRELAELLTQAVEEVGKDGTISIETGSIVDDELEVTKGMKFNQGFIDKKFGNIKNPNAKITLENPLILLFKGDLSNSKNILPALSYAHRENRPLLLLTEDLRGDALAIALLNKLKGNVNIIPVKIPGFGENRLECLLDIEALTGSQIVDPQVGDGIASAATKQYFGSASSVVVSQFDTVIVNGKGTQEKVDERIVGIRNRLKESGNSIGDEEQLKERLTKLTSGAAVIKVGGNSQFEVKEKKDRLDDALNSTQTALEGGILPGGGISLLKASDLLSKADFGDISFDTKIGIDIVRRALSSPFEKILENSGLDGRELKAGIINGDFSKGINAQTGEVVDMYEAGIIDPFITIKNALINSAGVTTLLSATEVAITSVRGEKEGF